MLIPIQCIDYTFPAKAFPPYLFLMRAGREEAWMPVHRFSLVLAVVISVLGCGAWGEGAASGSMQYFRPEDPYFVGDCMPFYHDGVFHLYYLLDENHHRGKNGLGGHQWAHASTRDLVHWEHHPLAIPLTDDWEASMCTGSVFFYDGLYRGYYASRKMDGTEHLSVAVSEDGIHFTKTEPRIFASPEGPYVSGPYRDPCVFRDEKTGLFHLLATAELKTPPIPGRGGCLAHLVSEDLAHWRTEAPFLVPGFHGQPECSEVFRWNDWYYLVFSLEGMAQYRMARDPLGPWTRPPVFLLDSPMARVMKTAEFGDSRRIGVAFLPTLDGGKDDGGQQYAGNAVFREIVQDANGYLWSKFPAEMTPRGGAPIPLQATLRSTGAAMSTDVLEVRAGPGMDVVSIPGCPVDGRITCEIAGSGAGDFGILLRADAEGGQGYTLRFSGARGKVDLRPCAWSDLDENGRHAINNVDGLDRAFRVEIVMKGDIIDVAVETDTQPRTLVNRFPEQRGGHVFLYACDSMVTFRNLEIRALE